MKTCKAEKLENPKKMQNHFEKKGQTE